MATTDRDIGDLARAREALANWQIVGGIVLWIEIVLLVGIPFAVLQIVITGWRRSAWIRVCRQPRRGLIVLGSIVLFFLVAGVVYVETGMPLYFAVLSAIVAQPTLRALRAVRFIHRQVADAEHPALVEQLLFPDGRQRIARGRSDAGRQRAKLWFVATGTAVALMVILIVLQETGSVAFGVSGFVTLCIVIAGYLYRRGRRHLQADAGERRRADSRPPVVLLRSFGDDSLRFERGLTALTQPLRPSFEQLITRECEAMGPVIAIGEPGCALPPLGASRADLQDRDWQTAVHRLMQEANMIVFVLGATEGLIWEFRTAVTQVDTDVRALVLVPPLEASELEARWQEFFSATRERLANLPERLPAGVVAVAIRNRATRIISSSKRAPWDYRLAVRLASLSDD